MWGVWGGVFLVEKSVGIFHLVLMLFSLALLSSVLLEYPAHGWLGDWLVPGARE